MTLPDFLSIDDGGFIHVAGRRVGLHHVLRVYNEGLSPEEIALEFPSLPLAVVHKIIAFYLEHSDEVQKYVAEQERIVDDQMAQSQSGPTIEQLRARLAERQALPNTKRPLAG